MNFLYVLMGLVGNLVGWWHDYSYSSRFIYYRAGEGHGWFTDKHGFMDKKKPFLGLAIEQGVAVGCALIAWALGYEDQMGLAYMGPALGAGLAHYLQAQLKLRKRLKHDRTVQIRSRKALKSLVVEDRAQSIEKLMWQGLSTIKGNSGRYWHPSVQFLYVDANTADEARRPIAEKLYDWLLLPETDQKRIWVDLKFHPKEAAA